MIQHGTVPTETTQQQWRTISQRSRSKSATQKMLNTNSSRKGATQPHQGIASTTDTGANTAASSTPATHRSRWKELRNSVRIKATLDRNSMRAANATRTNANEAIALRSVDARIADLCDQDRHKIAKLIRRLVEMSALQEETTREFEKEKADLHNELREFKQQNNKLVHEVDEVQSKLTSNLQALQQYQERVLVLEEMNEKECHQRFAMDETVDQLRLQVDKLKKLIHQQKQENLAEQQQLRSQVESLETALKESQDELIRERHARIQEQKHELSQRIDDLSFGNPRKPRPRDRNNNDKYKTTPDMRKHCDSSSSVTSGKQRQISQEELQEAMTSFLNTSMEFPERIRDIMDQWTTRMEQAVFNKQNGGQQEAEKITTPTAGQPKPSTNSIGCQTASVDDEQAPTQPATRPEHEIPVAPATAEKTTSKCIPEVPVVKRLDFDQYLATEEEEEEEVESVGDLLRCTTPRELKPEDRIRSSNGRHVDADERLHVKRSATQQVEQTTSTDPSACPRNRFDISNGSTAASAPNGVGFDHGRPPSHKKQVKQHEEADLGHDIVGSNWNDLDLYDMSLFEVVAAMENTNHFAQPHIPASKSSASGVSAISTHDALRSDTSSGPKSPLFVSSRIGNLRKRLQQRQDQLGIQTTNSHDQSDLDDEDLDSINAFYSQDSYPLHSHGMHEPSDLRGSVEAAKNDQHVRNGNHQEQEHDLSMCGPALSAHDLAVREAVERDMETLSFDLNHC